MVFIHVQVCDCDWHDTSLEDGVCLNYEDIDSRYLQRSSFACQSDGKSAAFFVDGMSPPDDISQIVSFRCGCQWGQI